MGLKLEKVDAENWIVLEDFKSPLDSLVVVPAGFKTDLASIPQGLRWLIDDDEEGVMEAGVFHDMFYRLRQARFGKYIKRENVDQMFLDLMKKYQVSWWKRNLAYAGVRIGGSFSWK